MGRDILGTYAANGTLIPLDECIANEGIDMSQYRDVAVAQSTFNGSVYGIPEFFNSLMLKINTKALEDVGLTLDDVSTTDWAAVSALNEQLTVGNGATLTRMGFDSKLPEFLPLWTAAIGGSMLTEDGRTATLNSPEVVQALEFAVSIYGQQGGFAAMKAFRDTWDFFGANNQIVADQIGFWPMEQWYMNVLAGGSPDAPVAFKAVTDQDGNPITYVTGSAWAIPVGSGNPEAACAFARAMTSPEAWTRAAQVRADLRAESGAINTGVYTANRVADGLIFDGGIVGPIENPAFQQGVDVILSLQDAGFGLPTNPAGAEFKQAWQDAVNRVLNGEQTAQEALDQAQAEAQAALDAAWSGIQ
jgi:multiple sugar transport system substrate-binding protein